MATITEERKQAAPERETIFLPEPYEGLRLAFAYTDKGDKVASLSGLSNHIALADRPADRSLCRRLCDEIGGEALLEIKIDSPTVFDHVLCAYPDYWRYVSDRSVIDRNISPLDVTSLSAYFAHESHPGRLLRSYRDVSQLWADKASRNLLALLIEKTDLYLAEPIGRLTHPTPAYQDITGFDEEYCW